MGGGALDQIFTTLADLQASKPRLNTQVTLNGDDYTINSIDFGEGISVNSLFANPLRSTASSLMNSNLEVVAGDTKDLTGFFTAGDGGDGQWVATGNVITISQTPSDLVATSLSDALGNEFTLIYNTEVRLNQLGAGYGSDDTGAFKALEAVANISGGLTVLGNADDTYLLNQDLIITKSRVNFDFLGGVLSGTSSARITFNGDSGIDGDRSLALQYCSYKNVNVTGAQKGPNFTWCDFPLISNVSRDNDSGTFINVAYSTMGTIENIGIHNGDPLQNIGVLLLHCIQCTVDDLKIDGGGFVYGLQVKGGYNNKVTNSIISDIDDMSLGFRDRGDAPWGASLTTGTYPYITGSWGAPDIQRASRNTIFENCEVVNCPNTVGFITQESTGTTTKNCTADGCSSGFSGNKLLDGLESGFSWVRCKSRDGSGVGFIVSGDNSLQLLSGVKIEDCIVSGYTANDGYRITLCNKPIINDSTATNNTGQIGMSIIDCSYARIGNPTAQNNDIGIMVSLSSSVERFISIEGGVVSDNTTSDIDSWYPGIYSNLKGMPSVQSVDAALQQSFQRFALNDDKSYAIDVQMIATGNTNKGLFRKVALASAAGGVASLQSFTDIHADINPSAWTGLEFSAVGDSIRVRATGIVGDTVDWQVGAVSCVEIPFI